MNAAATPRSASRKHATTYQKRLASGPWQLDHHKFRGTFAPEHWDREKFVRALSELMPKIQDFSTALKAIKSHTAQRTGIRVNDKEQEGQLNASITVSDIKKTTQLLQQHPLPHLHAEISGAKIGSSHHTDKDPYPVLGANMSSSPSRREPTVTVAAVTPPSSDLSAPPQSTTVTHTSDPSSVSENAQGISC